MNDEESGQCRQRLGEVVIRHQLAWVLEQVEQHFRLRRTSEEKIQTISERRGTGLAQGSRGVPLTPTGAYSPGPKARFVATREFTAREKLEILVDAIESSGCRHGRNGG